jgi:hypothetical protein
MAKADARMHAARAVPGGRRTRQDIGPASDLPEGSFVTDGDRMLVLRADDALP